MGNQPCPQLADLPIYGRCLLGVMIALCSTTTLAQDQTGDSFKGSIAPLLQKFCVQCHNAETQRAELRLDNLRPPRTAPEDLQRWGKVLEMVSIGDMPPEDARQPTRQEREVLVHWIGAEFRALGRGLDELEQAFPKYANRVNHEDLFSGQHTGPAATSSRVWRMSPSIYRQLMQDLELGDFTTPLASMRGEGFDDYALLYADESTIRTLLQNAKRVAMSLVHGRLVKPRGAAERNPQNKPHRKRSRHRVLADFAKLESPDASQMETVIRVSFGVLLHREPSAEELQRYLQDNLQPNVEAGGADAGLRGMLVSILLSPELLFRMEMGLGEKLPDGRRRLSPHELAYALSYALYDHPIESLLQAADQGRLVTRSDVEREVRRLLNSREGFRGQIPAARRGKSFWAVGKGGEVDKPRLLRFFREYFDYEKAVDVFKDDIRHGGVHRAKYLVDDADWLVLKILADDRDVLARLLTTDEFFVAYGRKKTDRYTTVYNLQPTKQAADGPRVMPQGQRAGLLTHPAWLVAHSGNFETDPVRRGKWIQERLLGGVVPDIPIGVEAQLPDAPHQTLRQRFEVVRAERCWRCHKKMNPLGEPFEIFDDFGQFRQRHHVTDNGEVLASALEINRKQRKLQAEPTISVDASGSLRGTGDPTLDGEVSDAIDLVHRLAKSQRARQVFMRHIFRYWMGRNETLSDSPTLIAMDRAYVQSGGSFRETLLALLTSDSFLLRKD